ncbi:MAG TPA: hypothetical protein VNO70_15755 [Blastocatellia bacterium]|nr:hypothetical protein [Blastocatellia bacterium]
MSQDPIERRMEFIIEQQAQFAADMMGLKEQQQRQAAHMDRLSRAVEQLTADVATLHTSMVDMRDAVLSLTHIVEAHGNQIAALSTVGKETDARLNALITVVERHIGDHK